MYRIVAQRSPRSIYRVRPRNLATNYFGQFDDAGSSCCGFGSCRRRFFFQGCSVTDYENDCISSKVSVNSIHMHQIRWSHTSATATDTDTQTTRTTIKTNDDDEKEEDPGEILYQNAMKTMEEAQALQDQKEQEKSKQMYEAWKKAQEVEVEEGSNNTNNKNRKSHGVKVVQTLVKETRKERRESSSSTTTAEKSLLSNMAISLLKEAANNYEHPEALIQLGNMALQNAAASSSLRRRNNNDDKCDDEAAAEISKALDMFHRAGIAGSRVGWYNLGNLYWTGYPPHDEDGDSSSSDDELSSANNNDDDSIDTTTAALSASAATKEEEEPGRQQILTKNIPKSMEAFKKAIELGDCDAMYFVGVHKMAEDNNDNNNDNDTANNIQSGMDLIQRSADLGHNGAKYYMALLKLNGEPNLGIEPCSIEEFTMLLDDAIDAGNVDARFVRGHSHYYGIDGYPQSYKNALDDFLIAANEGHPDSCVSAGAMLHTGMVGGDGTTIQRNQRRAFELYQQAGELGSKEGWQNVVACYMTGKGVPKSLETARYIRETILKEEPLLA